MKNCRNCKTLKELVHFRNRLVNGKNYVAHICKECDAAARGGKVIKRLYDCTPEQYHAMVIAQNGQCKICGTKNPGGGRIYFTIDHCHTTKRVRGLLCTSCNLAIGIMQESAERLISAAKYLEEFNQNKKLEVCND